MVTTILVPIDDSRWSRGAAALARWLAARPEAEVRVTGLHVVNVTQVRGRFLEDLAGLLGFEPVVVPDRVEKHFLDLGRKLLDAFAAACAAEGVACETVLEQGNVVDRIVHHAAAHDLVVLGLRGETEERFPGQGGGTAERVLRRVPTTTLVAPADLRSLSGVVLGYDGSAGANRALVATARLVELARVPVHAVYVGDEAEAVDLEPVRQRLGDAALTTAVVPGEPQEVLPAEAARLGYDLLALGYRGRSRIKDIFLGRTTEWLVGHVDIGVLVAR